MTLRAVGFGPRFPRAWLFPILAMTLLLGLAVTGRISRSVVADLLAWWPVWVALVLTAWFGRGAKVGSVNVSGLVPLAALAFVALFAWGHLAGWDIMPSSAQHLQGPSANGVVGASMTFAVDGEVRLSAGADTLYAIEPIRGGGSVGMPTATEVAIDDMVAVTLEVPTDPGVYVYAGWNVLLSDRVTWDLDVEGAVEADLTALQISRMSVDGAGSLALGEAGDAIPVTVSGHYEVTVPASWTLTSDGAVSPGLGTGWVLTVVGTGSLTVRER